MIFGFILYKFALPTPKPVEETDRGTAVSMSFAVEETQDLLPSNRNGPNEGLNASSVGGDSLLYNSVS